jgi:putative oxidoreductase
MRVFEKLQPLSLLGLRLALGIISFYHGSARLMRNPSATLPAFTGLGLPSYLLDVIATLELFGAILLVLGLLTRFTALLLTIEMGVALAGVDVPRGGIYAVQNYELSLAMCAAAFALVTTGAGWLSIDAIALDPGSKSRPKIKAS